MRLLFVSGYAPERLGEQDNPASNTPFLPKPFTPEGLLGAVREVLDGVEQV